MNPPIKNCIMGNLSFKYIFKRFKDINNNTPARKYFPVFIDIIGFGKLPCSKKINNISINMLDIMKEMIVAKYEYSGAKILLIMMFIIIPMT
jgi:hypothetical protein